ncbi:MAG: transposase [Clostridia bacterium]|nr:transposase [Clostridia bacterium]
MNKSYPERKHPRLKNYDYGQNGCYFVTICVKDKKPLLGSVSVGRDALIPPQTVLSLIGKVAEKYILNIEKTYKSVKVENYVIMPNHIHLLLLFDSTLCDDGGMRASRPTLFTVIRSFKTMVTREIGYSVWQDSFYDRVVNSVEGYAEVWEYIEENPFKWIIGKGDDY